MRQPENLHEECVASRQLLDGRLLKVFSDTVRLPDGREAVREWIRHPGAVAVIAHLRASDELILERQFRYPVGKAVWELPAGKLDPGEDPEACGRRELEEETGWRAGALHYVLPLLPCIGYSDEVIHIFYCDELSPGRAGLDEGECLDVHRLPLAEVRHLLESGAIQDSKTLVGLYWLFARLDAEARA
ncbi:MAG: NUDIX hydrolase [Candidatus Delongbacteria bacterium]